jgi:predicted membrane protein
MKAPQGLFETIRDDVAAQVEYAHRLDRAFFVVGVLGTTVFGLGSAARKTTWKAIAQRLLSDAVTKQFRLNQRIQRRTHAKET